jgi:hypothetical protein
MNRRQRRMLQNNIDSETAENLAEKIFQFNQLPDKCVLCEKNFDKTNKDMVRSWSVVVRPTVVRLFCPGCIKKTKDILGDSNESSTIE